MGNKFKLIPQLLPLFPEKIDTFYDLFGGSGCVSGNIDAEHIVYNELNINIVKLFELFIKYDASELINYIHTLIKEYNLNTENMEDGNVFRDFYERCYLKLRDTYNSSDRDYRMLYVLTFYSFSNLIRFNNNSEFNMPFGSKCFNKLNEFCIEEWCNKIREKDIKVLNRDALDLLSEIEFKTNDFIYLDPPYTNTMAIYNEQRAFGGWNKDDDKKMFGLLEELNNKGIKWGLSNVFENKGIRNQHLIDWCEKNGWTVIHLDYSYSTLGKGDANSDEVFICNYKVERPERYNLWEEIIDE